MVHQNGQYLHYIIEIHASYISKVQILSYQKYIIMDKLHYIITNKGNNIKSTAGTLNNNMITDSFFFTLFVHIKATINPAHSGYLPKRELTHVLAKKKKQKKPIILWEK